MSLLHKSLLAFGLLLASVLAPSGTALAANNYELQTLIRKCEAQNGEACTELGALHQFGIGVPQDYSKAAEYYTKGCELQDGSACGSLGFICRLNKDYTKAAEYYAKGCELQEGAVCGFLGNLYFEGLGVTQNYDKAANYFAKGCEYG